MVTIVLTPISPARRTVSSISLRWRSPIGPGSSGLAEQLSAAISRPRASISFSAALSAALSASRRSARKCGPLDQPPPVISMPSTPSLTHLSSMSVKERSPITSVQMESFMAQASWFVDRATTLVVVDPDRAGVGGADAVLEPAHALGAGLDARDSGGSQERLVAAFLRVDRLGDPEVDVGPAVAEALGVQRAHAVDGEALLLQVGHAVMHDLRPGSPWIS